MIVLASASPRRRELLGGLVKDFCVDVSGADEHARHKAPWRVVRELASAKCDAVAARHPDDIVIAADTVVCLGRDILGKPEDEDDAKRMLRALSGKRHTVFTGVCVNVRGKKIVYHEKSHVWFCDLDDKFLDDYVASGSPMDKAGAYGIQDKGTVRRYDGEYANIVGLPLRRLEQILREADERSRIGN